MFMSHRPRARCLPALSRMESSSPRPSFDLSSGHFFENGIPASIALGVNLTPVKHGCANHESWDYTRDRNSEGLYGDL